MIKMEYPNIKDNDLCDGKIHDIIPLNIDRIENSELYLLEYYDRTKKCNGVTILYKAYNGEITKIPLLSYDLLFYLIDNKKIDLSYEDLGLLYDYDYTNRPNQYIKANQPLKDFQECLALARAAIILYIDANGNIYLKNENKFVKVDDDLLLKIMQQYDIEWHDKETNALASQKEIDYAIQKTIGHLLTPEREDGLSYEERYKIGNIHHYTVSYQYTYGDGSKKFHNSI